MGNAITMQVTGLKELQSALFSLPPAIAERALRAGVASGAAVIRQAVETEAPIYAGEVQAGHPPPGTLKKAIYQVRLTEQCTPTKEVFLVSARKGKKFQAVARGRKGAQSIVNLDAYYWTWVEFGHHVHPGKALTKKGRRAMEQGVELIAGAQFIMPNPFMRRAYEKTKMAAQQAMVARMKERVAAAIKKAQGKG